MSEGDAPKAEVANGKIYDLDEVKKHTREDDCWLVVDGDVFDVTNFLDEHPGGFDIIISNTGQSLSFLDLGQITLESTAGTKRQIYYAGKDATEDFDEIGHSKSARELLSNYKIGAYKGGKPPAKKATRSSAVKVQASSGSSTLITLLKVLLPFVVLAAIFLPRFL